VRAKSTLGSNSEIVPCGQAGRTPDRRRRRRGSSTTWRVPEPSWTHARLPRGRSRARARDERAQPASNLSGRAAALRVPSGKRGTSRRIALAADHRLAASSLHRRRISTGSLRALRQVLALLLVLENVPCGLASFLFETRPKWTLAAAVEHFVPRRLAFGLVTLRENLLELCVRHRVVHQNQFAGLVRDRTGLGSIGRLCQGGCPCVRRLSARIRFAARSYRSRGRCARGTRRRSRGWRNGARRSRRRRLRWRLTRLNRIRVGTGSKRMSDRASAACEQQATDSIHDSFHPPMLDASGPMRLG
jgi:hypothetical protein